MYGNNSVAPAPAAVIRNGVYTSGDEEEGFLEQCCTCLAAIFCFPLFICNMLTTNQYQRAVIFRMGRLRHGGAVGPGSFCMVPCVDHAVVVDQRVVTHDIPEQDILTQDSVTVTVDAVMYYHVFDPILAVTNVTSYHYCTKLLAAAMLRSALGMHSLKEILQERDKIAGVLKNVLDQATDPWGVKVDRMELKNVSIPWQMQRAMAAEAEAVRDARAKVIAAQGEANSAKTLREAADNIKSSPGALQIRYLQTLQEIASDNNYTVLFPMPVEIMKALARK